MLGTRTVVATVTDITTRLDMETLDEISVRELALNEIGRVTISLTHPVVCEPYDDQPRTGWLHPDRPADPRHRRRRHGDGDPHRATPTSYWHRWTSTRSRAPRLKGQKPAVLWFTGLSGAGKSTIANLVEKRLHALGSPHHDPGRRQRPPRAEPRPWLLPKPIGWKISAASPRFRNCSSSGPDRSGVVHLALSRRTHAGAGLRRRRRVPRDLRRYAGRTNAADAIRRACTRGPTPARSGISPVSMRPMRRRSRPRNSPADAWKASPKCLAERRSSPRSATRGIVA